MKKITTLFLVLSMAFCFTACNAADKTDTTRNEAEIDTSEEEDAYGLTQEKYETMTAEDLLANIEDINNITTDEYIWLVSTYRFNPINEADLTIADNITDEALYSIAYEAKPAYDTYIDTFYESPYPQVRGYAASSVSTMFTGLSEGDRVRCLKLIETETDDYVLLCLTKALYNSANEDPKIGEFLLKMADDDNAIIRENGVLGLTSYWSIGVDGAVEKVIERMNDENMSVREVACMYCSGLEDTRVIEPLKAILDNPDEAELHPECLQAMIDFWYDYPFFEDTNEEAYQITMDYLRRVPRTKMMPKYKGFYDLESGTTTDAYIAWKETATYFDTNELFDVMVDILKDENADTDTREFTMEVIYAHMPERMGEVQSIVDGLTDTEAESIRSAYADIIEE